MQLEKSLSTLDVAKKLGVTKGLVNRWCRQGRLKAKFQHGRWWIEDREVEAFEKIPREPGNPLLKKK